MPQKKALRLGSQQGIGVWACSLPTQGGQVLRSENQGKEAKANKKNEFTHGHGLPPDELLKERC